MPANRMPTYFLPHGGGPWPLLDGPMRRAHDGLERYLGGVAAQLPAPPRAVLLASAHWESPEPAVGVAERPGMLYDYSGFPPETYRFRYDAPGSPEFAERALALLAAAGIRAERDGARGFDHGTFVPLMVAFPSADVPVVALSLREDGDAAAHVALGEALAPLRDEGVLIAGSGMTFHNMRAFFSPDARSTDAAAGFDAWLAETLALPPEERRARLIAWRDAPGATVAHPTPEHFLPLLVAAGAAGIDAAERTFADDVLGFPQSGFRFGE